MKNATRNTMGRYLLAAAIFGGTLIGCAPQDDTAPEASPEQLKRRCAIPQKTMAEIDAAEWEVYGTDPTDGEDIVTLKADDTLRGPFEFEVRVLVITNAAGAGNVTDAQIAEQLTVMNDGFSTRTGGHDMKMSFRLASVERIVKPEWYGLGYGSPAEVAAKTYFHAKHPGPQVLRVYLTDIGDGLLGWATFPQDYTSEPHMDGVVILSDSLPGGAAEPYNLGDTATHEVGHWVGLYHTFQNGCSAPGDLVRDTSRVARPNFGAPAVGSVDSCTSGDGIKPNFKDLTQNFMDYTDDIAMDSFTEWQSYRGLRYVDNFRFVD